MVRNFSLFRLPSVINKPHATKQKNCYKTCAKSYREKINMDWGTLRFQRNLLFYTLFILWGGGGQAGNIQDWEKACVVGECKFSNSGYTACEKQSLDIRLGHPSRQNVRSEPVFRNRPHTMAFDTCGDNSYIPLCCPTKKTEEAMLIGGLGAEENEFPHHVRILIRTARARQKCSGTIINSETIITAASCLMENGRPISPSDLEVIVAQNVEHQQIPENVHSVSSIKIHEAFSQRAHDYGRDADLALLKLRTPLKLGKNQYDPIRALRIPEKGFKAAGKTGIIVGWGRTAKKEKPIGTLLKMNAHINTEQECTQKSTQALHLGTHFRKTSLLESPRDEFGDVESFEISKTKRRGGSSSRRTGSIFDDDDFFSSSWGRRSSLAEWDAHHEPINLGALRLGKLWEGGIEAGEGGGGSQSRSHSTPLTRFPSGLLCVGGGDNSHGYNRADSGSPLICDGTDGTPVLCGISSFGRNEFQGEWPATYVNVAHYSDWIRSHAGRQEDATITKEVIDGEPIPSPDEASFYIRIRNKKTNATCGGALVNSRTVVSSVACVPTDVRIDDLVVTSGEFSVEHKGTEHEVDGVATRETYKNYQSRSENRKSSSESSESPTGTSLRGDFPQLNLAVLKLYRPVRAVKPIDMIKPHMQRMIVYEYGWRTDGRDKAMNRWAYREVPLGECKETYGAVGILVDEAHLCAVETYSGGERCNKELGNPLICVDRQMKKYLCGVTSFRDCSFAFPTVFTNIRQNLDWIQL